MTGHYKNFLFFEILLSKQFFKTFQTMECLFHIYSLVKLYYQNNNLNLPDSANLNSTCQYRYLKKYTSVGYESNQFDYLLTFKHLRKSTPTFVDFISNLFIKHQKYKNSVEYMYVMNKLCLIKYFTCTVFIHTQNNSLKCFNLKFPTYSAVVQASLLSIQGTQQNIKL